MSASVSVEDRVRGGEGLIAIQHRRRIATGGRELFSDPLVIQALENSLILALVVTPICLILGTLSAVGISRFRYRGRGAVAGLVGAPLVVPWLLIGVGALLFFSRLHVPLSLQTIGIMHVVAGFPLVTAIVSARLVRFDVSLEEAAR